MDRDTEERIAHLERANDDMSAELARAAARLDRLERQVAQLVEREAARSAEGGGGTIHGDERPPHY